MKKYTLALVLTLTMVLTLAVPAFAAPMTEENASGEVMNELSEIDIGFVEKIFESGVEAVLLDENGTNVKQRFIAENQNAYETGDYATILENLADESLSLVEPNIIPDLSTLSDDGIMPLIMLKRTARATRKFYLLNGSGQQTKDTFTVVLEADFTVYDSNEKMINGADSKIRVVGQSNNPTTRQSKVERISNESSRVLSGRDAIEFTGTLHISTRSTGVPFIGADNQTERVSFFGYA